MNDDEAVVWDLAGSHQNGDVMYCPAATYRGARLQSFLDIYNAQMRFWSVTDATGKVIAEGRANRWGVKSVMVEQAAKALDRAAKDKG